MRASLEVARQRRAVSSSEVRRQLMHRAPIRCAATAAAATATAAISSQASPGAVRRRARPGRASRRHLALSAQLLELLAAQHVH